MYRALAYKAIDSDLDLDEEAPLLSSRRRPPKSPSNPPATATAFSLTACDVSRRVRDADVTAAASRVSVHPQASASGWSLQQRRPRCPGRRRHGRPRHRHRRLPRRRSQNLPRRRHPKSAAPAASARSPPSEHEPAPVAEAALLAETCKSRDDRDRNRAQSPLKPASDAVILNSTNMSLGSKFSPGAKRSYVLRLRTLRRSA